MHHQLFGELVKNEHPLRRVDKLPSPTKEDLDAYDLQYGIKRELIIQQLNPHAFNCSDSQWSSLNDRKWNHIRQDFDCIRPLIVPSYDEKKIMEEIKNHTPEIQFSDHFFPMTTPQHSVFSLSNIPVERTSPIEAKIGSGGLKTFSVERTSRTESRTGSVGV